MDFAYSNLPVRPSGKGISLLAKVLPGVRSVLDDVAPYAEKWEQHNRSSVQADGPLWIVLGDSMAQGIGASAYDRGWPGQVAPLIAPHRLVNLSFHGARVRDVLDRQLPAARVLGPAALVTVVIGANDVVWRTYRPDLPAAFAELLEQLPAGAVVGNLGNPHQAARTVDAQIRQAVRDRGLVLADLRNDGPRSWRGKLAADHFHPNDRGYAEMASVIAKAVDGSTG